MAERAINTQAVILAMHVLMNEYRPTALINIDIDRGVHIEPDGMLDVAPIEAWTLNTQRNGGENDPYPFRHYVTVNGVRFFAITTHPIEAPAPVEIEPAIRNVPQAEEDAAAAAAYFAELEQAGALVDQINEADAELFESTDPRRAAFRKAQEQAPSIWGGETNEPAPLTLEEAKAIYTALDEPIKEIAAEAWKMVQAKRQADA